MGKREAEERERTGVQTQVDITQGPYSKICNRAYVEYVVS